MKLIALLARAWRRRDGAAAIEFAIIGPLLLSLVIGVTELGLAIRASMLAQEAAAAGALYASQHGWDASGVSAAVLAATDEASLAASPAPQLYCGCPGASGVAAATCGERCPDDQAARQYVTVSATIPRVSVIRSSLGLGASMTATSTVRLP